MGKIANALEDRLKIQKGIDLPNKMHFFGEKSKILYLVKKSQMHKYRKKDIWLNSSNCERDLGVLVDSHLSMRQ